MSDKLSRRDFVRVTAATLATAACADGDGESPAYGADGDASPQDTWSADMATSPDTPPPDATPFDVADSGGLADVVDGTAEDTHGDIGVDADADASGGETEGGGDIPDTAADIADTSDVPAGTSFDLQDWVEDATAFPMGVQSGGARSDAVVVWTRYESANALLTVRLWLDTGQPGPYSLDASVDVTSADGGYSHWELKGLDAGAVYRFCWTDSQGRRSAVGRFRAALPPDSLETVVFGGSSCTSQNYRPFDTLTRAAEDGLDFFVLAGDTTYNDGSATLAEFRQRWAENLSDPGYRALTASTSIMASWDDHEVDNNWDPETVDTSVIDAATQSFFENLALRRVEESPDRIWRSYRWGKTLEVFVLDCRSERLPSQDQYISTAQMNWLKDGLSASNAVFKFIVNSVPITNMPPLYISQADRWEGYPAQRDEIIAHCAALDHVYWLSGDFHFPQIARLDPDGPGALMREILMGPGGQFPNPAYLLMLGNSQFDYVSAANNYTRFTVDPVAESLLVEFIDGDGDVVYQQSL